MATNGSSAQSAPALGGKAYPITDHTFDVVIVGAGGSGLRASVGCAQAGLRTALHLEGLPDALAYGRGARRHFRGARQHGPGRLALAHVRHCQGLRLARRPGRDRILCRNAPAAVYELDHWGVPFSRTEDGKIYQRPFGGMTTDFGEGPRSAPAPPPTAPATPSCTRSTAKL